MYFVMRYLGRNDGVFVLDGFQKETLNEAKHQFHNVMNTYAYGQNENYNFVMCEVKAMDGRTVMLEVDDRRPAPEPEPEAAEE
jgi:hypothetical protein